MVLHDLPTGAMHNLERFLDAAVELGVRLLQDFAPECIPILDGRIVRPLADILSPSASAGGIQSSPGARWADDYKNLVWFFLPPPPQQQLPYGPITANL